MLRKMLMVILVALFILGISKISFAMMCAGHSERQQRAQTESGEHKHTEHGAVMETTKEAIDVGNKICPVSGEKIDERMKATYEYAGKIYNFCCPMCIEEFKKDPEKYLKKVEEELKEEPKEENAGQESETEMPMGIMHEGHHH